MNLTHQTKSFFCALIFLGGFFLLPKAILAANVSFITNSIIDLSGLSETIYALANSECDSLTVNGSTLTVDIPSGSTFTLATASHNVLGLTPIGGNVTLTLSSSNISSGYASQWTVISSSNSTVSFLVGVLTPSVSYRVSTNGAHLNDFTASASGEVSFNDSIGSTDKIFTIVKYNMGGVLWIPPVSQEPTTPATTTPVTIPPATNNLPAPLTQGSLVKSSDSDKVYLITNNQRFWIPNAQAFEQAGYQWNNIQIVPTVDLATKPTANLIKTPDDPAVYALINNQRHHIPNPAIFTDYNYQWNDIIIVSQSEINGYVPATLFKTINNPDVYYLDNNQRHYIVSSTVFNQYHWQWEDIVEVSRQELDYYGEGDRMAE